MAYKFVYHSLTDEKERFSKNLFLIVLKVSLFRNVF